MRRSNRKALILPAVALVLLAGFAATRAADEDAPALPPLHVDGPPPPIPHSDVKAACTNCHTAAGEEMAGIPIPRLPHGEGLALGRCEQCHVYRVADGEFRENGFARPDFAPAPGPRERPDAPPALPHRLLLRENCLACHGETASPGPAPITTHPTRPHCLQCHALLRPDISGHFRTFSRPDPSSGGPEREEPR